MLNFDLLIIVLSCMQPLVIGFLVTFSVKNLFFNHSSYSYYNNIRNKQLTTKYYESGTYSRLVGKYSYDVYSISTCVAFVVYDVDILFFISEVNNIGSYSTLNLFLLLFLILLFILGLQIDYKVITFNWKM